MTKLYKYIQVMAKHGKLVQSYSQIWAIYTKVMSRNGNAIQSYSQNWPCCAKFWMNYANIGPDLAKYYNFMVRSG